MTLCWPFELVCFWGAVPFQGRSWAFPSVLEPSSADEHSARKGEVFCRTPCGFQKKNILLPIDFTRNMENMQKIKYRNNHTLVTQGKTPQHWRQVSNVSTLLLFVTKVLTIGMTTWSTWGLVHLCPSAPPFLTPVAFFLCSFSQASCLLRKVFRPCQSRSVLGGITRWKNHGIT